jgi:RimJ/RimL family protein N-acetyltransferase
MSLYGKNLIVKPQSVLHTKHLRLRPFEMSDVTAIHRFLSDPVATRYWSDPHTDIAQTERWVRGTMRGAPSEVRDYVLECEGDVIGKAGCWKAPEIGFFLLPAFQKQRYMTEALTAIIPDLFEAMPIVESLVADVDPRNDASLTILQRLGFLETHRAKATLQINGVWCDSVFLRLNRPSAEM